MVDLFIFTCDESLAHRPEETAVQICIVSNVECIQKQVIFTAVLQIYFTDTMQNDTMLVISHLTRAAW